LSILKSSDRLAIGACFASLFACTAAFAELPPVPVPPANPVTEAKRVLGKILFWDEQLSSDNTVSCGTCHQPAFGGGDPLPARNPGVDGAFNTPDDVFGSFGLIRTDAADDFERDVAFALNRQVTARAANPAINSAYATDLFWDGRARSQFVDPETGAVLIASGGALESQAVGPVVSSVEMAHADRDWNQVTQKLRTAGPMALATDVPADMMSAIESAGTYPVLFEEAFGDKAITAARIGMAIATYERTLISDQSPWDRFRAGDAGALTPGQQQGWNFFQATECAICHAPPLFTDNTFRNIGLRPNNQDIGREAVTGSPADRGRFKTASLRNLAGRANLMHTGQFVAVNQVFAFYAGPGAPGNPNRDPILPTAVPPPQVNAITDFIVNGLTDPRVMQEQFPFDRPQLHTESAPLNPQVDHRGDDRDGRLRAAHHRQLPAQRGQLRLQGGA
jgi:cytochrome c peroxidase